MPIPGHGNFHLPPDVSQVIIRFHVFGFPNAFQLVKGATLRRLLSVAAVAAVSVGLLVPAADAATTPIVSYKGLPGDWQGISFPCSLSGTPGPYSPAHVMGPDTPPAGQGSLKVAGSSTKSPVLFFGPSNAPLLSTLSAFDAYVFVPTTGGTQAEFDIEASEGPVDYTLSITSTGTGAWKHLDLTGSTVLNWDSFNNTTNAEDSGTSTLADFVTAHPNAVFDDLVTAPTNCGPSTFYLDDVHYAVGTTDNTVDFEAPTPTSLVNFSRPASVVSGTAVTLGARLTASSTPVAGQTVSLYAHGVGTSTYHLVKSVVTDATGAVSTKVANTSTTTYQWRFASSGSSPYAPANAGAFTIVSRQRVVVTTKPTSVTYGRTAHIDGYIRPIKGGVTARLIRLVNGKRIVVGYAKTGPKGVFNIYAPMKVRGTYTYLVSALPYPGQDLGQSATFKITTK